MIIVIIAVYSLYLVLLIKSSYCTKGM